MRDQSRPGNFSKSFHFLSIMSEIILICPGSRFLDKSQLVLTLLIKFLTDLSLDLKSLNFKSQSGQSFLKTSRFYTIWTFAKVTKKIYFLFKQMTKQIMKRLELTMPILQLTTTTTTMTTTTIPITTMTMIKLMMKLMMKLKKVTFKSSRVLQPK